MRWLDLIHRWTGGLIGLLLALLGLSGTILLWKQQWISAPGSDDPARQDVASLAAQLDRLANVAPADRPASILFASDGFGLSQLGYGRGHGAYANQGGEIVARWDSVWARPELWLFDLHHHLLIGEAGETISGIAGLVGLGFIVTGAILWWRTRRTFRLRLLPRRLTRSAILTHHRDLGILVAPLLAISMTTGMMLTLRPVASVMLAPFSTAGELDGMIKPPAIRGSALPARIDWQRVLARARQRFPDAEVRLVRMPREAGDLVQLRMRQPAEWLPNGRTMLWFDPADARLVEARDAMTLSPGLRAFNALFPLHAAMVGGIAYRLALTLAGVALTLLGTLAVWSFWARGGRRAKRTASRTPIAPLPAE